MAFCLPWWYFQNIIHFDLYRFVYTHVRKKELTKKITLWLTGQLSQPCTLRKQPTRKTGQARILGPYTIQYNTIQYNTIRVYCENTLSYNNGVLSQTEPKSGSVKARQLIYRYSTNTIKLRVKKLDMEYSIIKIITIKS